MKTLDNVQLTGKRVFLRVDYNVPLDKQHQVTDDLRIQATLPSIRKIIDAGGKVILASHLGRPKGKVAPEYSLRPVAEYLSGLLEKPIPMASDCIGEAVRKQVSVLQGGEVMMLENLRFHPGEEQDDVDFSKQLGELAEVYVNDAFAVSHRAHASVHGIIRYVEVCAAGCQMEKEVDFFRKAREDPKRPLAIVIGGAKISTKIDLLENLIPRTDCLIIGGAMANTFLKAQGKDVGKSLVEDDHLQTAAHLLQQAAQREVKVFLPVDAVVSPSLEDSVNVQQVSVDAVPPNTQILDVGPKSIAAFETALKDCPTIVWNGPLGAFEYPPFHKGTFALAEFLGNLKALTVIGGGDSAAAVKQAGVAEKVSYVSTGGGAFLELLEGKTLPGIAALEECSKRS
jgi:phosphoglycerate kinase